MNKKLFRDFVLTLDVGIIYKFVLFTFLYYNNNNSLVY